jgi:hypothetical protein
MPLRRDRAIRLRRSRAVSERCGITGVEANGPVKFGRIGGQRICRDKRKSGAALSRAPAIFLVLRRSTGGRWPHLRSFFPRILKAIAKPSVREHVLRFRRVRFNLPAQVIDQYAEILASFAVLRPPKSFQQDPVRDRFAGAGRQISQQFKFLGCQMNAPAANAHLPALKIHFQIARGKRRQVSVRGNSPQRHFGVFGGMRRVAYLCFVLLRCFDQRPSRYSLAC